MSARRWHADRTAPLLPSAASAPPRPRPHPVPHPQEAVADFARSQHAFLDNWCRFHGPLPPMLRSLLCDFSLEGPDVRTKMALWLLWLADNSAPGSYWHDTISRHLPPISGMAQPEFCTAEEIKELQWPPYAVPAAARRDALTHFWWEFGGGDMVELLGWRRRQGNEELDEKLFQAVAEAELMKLKTQAPQGEDDAAMEAREKVAEVLREIERVEAEHAAADAAAGLDEQGLRPLPPAEAFVWAYVNAEAHALGNGQRIVFMAQVGGEVGGARRGGEMGGGGEGRARPGVVSRGSGVGVGVLVGEWPWGVHWAIDANAMWGCGMLVCGGLGGGVGARTPSDDEAVEPQKP